MSRGVYKWCPVQRRVVEAHLALELPATVSHQLIMDEMPPTKHPATGEVYTSKAKFRAATKAAGCEEVGTAYENGYSPDKRREESFRRRLENVKR